MQEAKRKYNIWVGAVSSGKTYASNLVLALLLKHGPPGDAMIIGVNRETVQRNVLGQLYQFLGFPEPTSKSTETRLYGRRVYFVGAPDESSVKRIQGSTLAIAYVDEATNIPEPLWRMLQSRLRVKEGSHLLATCNPEGPAHWLKKEFIDRSHELDLIYWNFVLDDNPYLTQKYKDDLKKEYTGMWYKRYILGEWAVAHGLIYDGYDHLNLYEKPGTNPQYYVVGIDYGTTNATAAVLCSVNPTEWPQIKVEEEYYYDSEQKGRSIGDDDLATDIFNFVRYKNVRAVYVDPAAASLKVELRKRNLPVLDAKNDVIPGIKVTSKFISNKNLVIHKSCKTLIEHIQSYAWDHKAADRGEDKPIKKNDHICDSLRYAIYSAFPQGEFAHPDESLTYDQYRAKVYGFGDDVDVFNSQISRGF